MGLGESAWEELDRPLNGSIWWCAMCYDGEQECDNNGKKCKEQKAARVARIPSVIPGIEFDIRAIETHYQKMVVVREKGG